MDKSSFPPEGEEKQLPQVEGALVQINVYHQSKHAVRVLANGVQTVVLGPGQAVIGMLPDSALAPVRVELERCDLRYVTNPTDPDAAVPGDAPVDSKKIELV